MIAFLRAFALNTWQLVAEMAPYLLFGFAMAGLLHILINAEKVRKMLGKRSFGTIVKACLIGVPMPLCSCSVIPVAATLHRSGASRGATAAFLSSTPQTGVDSILATYSLLGGAFTIVRVVVAFISGLVAGTLVDLFAKEAPKKAPEPTLSLQPNAPLAPATANFNSISLSPTVEPEATCCAKPSTSKPNLRDGLRHGFVTLPADLGNALLIGLLLAGLITTLLPDDLLSGALSNGPLAFILATLISLPLYVCATSSIPMAYALIAAGLSPGAALVFLIVGPATNTATVVAVWKMLGRHATLIYISSLIAISWIAGTIFNSVLSTQSIRDVIHHHETMQLSALQNISGIVLVGLLALPMALRLRRSKAAPSCCSK
ncbi:MAG: SO_0444 family Cu/Zn efflux transporter [Opitutaceae bacterium]